MEFVRKNILYIAWFQALAATLGSLLFSEVLGWTPCVLCWYQRIFMYPLVIIIAVGILKKDKNLPFYALPLSILGGLISLYHTLLQYSIIPEKIGPCTLGISCVTNTQYILGVITLPFLSLLSFAIISILLWVYYLQTQSK